MAIKTFSDNTPLSASDVNTYLANAGLVYVGGVTFTGSAAIDVDNVFSSSFDDYRAVVTFTGMSGSDTVFIRYIDTSGSVVTTNNYDVQLVEFYSSTTAPSALMAQNAARLMYLYGVPGYGSATIDFASPYLAKRTQYISTGQSTNSTTYVLVDTISHSFRLTTQFRGFRILSGALSTMTGTVRVFGVRQA